MSSDPPKGVVWVLGAGFSRFLGAPLLTELFKRHGIDRVRRVYEPLGFQFPNASEVYKQFELGQMNRPEFPGASRC
jgi:hypothetical protein